MIPQQYFALSSSNKISICAIRRTSFTELDLIMILKPAVFICDSNDSTMDESPYSLPTCPFFIHWWFWNGICLGYNYTDKVNSLIIKSTQTHRLLKSLQTMQTRISKQNTLVARVVEEPIWPAGKTTAKIRAVTNHLKGVEKLVIPSCIVNGPGEMVDADFGPCWKCGSPEK